MAPAVCADQTLNQGISSGHSHSVARHGGRTSGVDPPAPRAPRSSPLSLVFHPPPARLRPPRGNFRRLGILQSEPRHESIHRAFRLTSAAFTEKICAASSLPPSSNPSPSFANPSASSESSLTRLCLPPSPGPPSSLTPPSETPCRVLLQHLFRFCPAPDRGRELSCASRRALLQTARSSFSDALLLCHFDDVLREPMSACKGISPSHGGFAAFRSIKAARLVAPNAIT